MNKIVLLIFITLEIFSQEKIDLNFVNTGSNMTVAILNTSDTLVNFGDTLAVFYDFSINEKKCGGFVIWNNDRVALTVWGYDNTSELKDGFLNNEEYLPIYHIKDGLIRKKLEPVFMAGSKFYFHNGISVIENLK